jgi:hypothetical protein
MLWLIGTVLFGVLALGFLVSGLRFLFLDELVVAAMLLLATYGCAVQAGVIQPIH